MSETWENVKFGIHESFTSRWGRLFHHFPLRSTFGKSGRKMFFGRDLYTSITAAPSPTQVRSIAKSSHSTTVPNSFVRAIYESLVKKYENNHLDFLDTRTISRVLMQTVNHPVATLAQLDKYDPTHEIGFCYGRAMAADHIALEKGLKRENIRKLYIVGDLRSGPDPEWRFHVTTLVRGKNANDKEEWYAIDPVLYELGYREPVTMAQWVRIARSIWDKKAQAKLYMTDADIILPDIRVAVPIDQETGKNLVELSFDPAKKKGFKPQTVGTDITYWVPDQGAQSHYFTDVSNFDFFQAKVNEKIYLYNNYFIDLMNSFIHKAFVKLPQKKSNWVWPSGHLGSPNWQKLSQK